MKEKKKKRRIWWSVGVSFSVVLFVSHVLGIGSSIALNRELAEARTDGFPVDADAIFLTPPPRDEDNAAPFYEQMVLLQTPAGVEFAERSKHSEALRRGYSDFDPDQARGYFDAMSELIELAEKAARLPECRMNKDWTNPVTVMLPELALSKDVSKAFASRAMLRLEDGNIESALDDLHRMLVIANHMEGAGFTIGHLVSVALRMIYSGTVEYMVSSPNADEQFIKGVLAQLEDWPTSVDWTNTLRLEAYANVWIPRNLDKIHDDYWMMWEMGDGIPKDDREWERLSFRFPKTRYDAALITLEHWNHVLDTYDPGSSDPLAWARRIDSRLTTGSGFLHAGEALSTEFSMSIEPVFRVGIRVRAQREVLKSSLTALLAKKSGREYLADGVGTDPWTKADLLYKATSDGFMIYSVGGNGIDDGGDREEVKDIVFEYPRLRQPAPSDFYQN